MLCLSSDARQFGFAHKPGDFAGQDMLLLAVGPPATAEAEAKPWFHSVEMLPNATVRLDGRVLQVVTVMRGLDLTTPR